MKELHEFMNLLIVFFLLNFHCTSWEREKYMAYSISSETHGVSWKLFFSSFFQMKHLSLMGMNGEHGGAGRHVTLFGMEKTRIWDTPRVKKHARFVFICFVFFSLKSLSLSHIDKVYLSQQLSCLLVPESWEKSCLCTFGEYHCWCGFHSMGAQRWGRRWGEKEERTGEKCCVGWKRWQVQRFVLVWVRVHVCVCVGWCVGAGESGGLHRKRGEEILSGKAKWRIWIGMLGDSCKWEERYGVQRTHDIQTACKCQTRLWWCSIDPWACI